MSTELHFVGLPDQRAYENFKRNLLRILNLNNTTERFVCCPLSCHSKIDLFLVDRSTINRQG